MIHDRLWLIVIASKRYGFSVRQAVAQTLAYMVGAPVSPVFALITTGEDYLFIKFDRDSSHYALSNKSTLSTVEGNELYGVAQILNDWLICEWVEGAKLIIPGGRQHALRSPCFHPGYDEGNF